MSEVQKTLPDHLYTELQHQSFVLLHTIDVNSGAPTSRALSWVLAVSPSVIRIALDQRSSLIENLRANPNVGLSLFGAASVHAVTGKAVLLDEPLKDVPFDLVCVEITLEKVQDAMFYGGRLTGQPEFKKIYDERAAERLDEQVFAAMKKA